MNPRPIAPRVPLLGRLLLTGCALLGMTSGMAHADTWPARPITLVVPFPPGGTTDVGARILANGLSTELGQSVVVENRPGASGNIGSTYVARAQPDGYTLVMSGVGSHAANVGLYPDMPYDPVKDFTHITSVTSSPNAIVVNADFPADSLQELVALIRENPDKYNYASPGTGSSGHLAFELFKRQAALVVQHIPYKGAAPALTDLIGGQVPILIMVADTLQSHVQTGKIRVLAVTSDARSTLFPDVPTVGESGYPGFKAVSWTGLSAPAGLPDDIRQKLFTATDAVLASPNVQAQFARTGNAIEVRTPDAFTTFVADEVRKWGDISRDVGATP